MGLKKIVVSPRTVSRKSGSYVIVIPPKIGKKLHGKTVMIIIEILDELDKGGKQ